MTHGESTTTTPPDRSHVRWPGAHPLPVGIARSTGRAWVRVLVAFAIAITGALVSVGSGPAQAAVPATVPAAVGTTGSISGTVLDPVGGGSAGLSGVVVSAESTTGCSVSGSPITAVTDGAGAFALTGVPVGQYRVSVQGSSLPRPQYAPGTIGTTAATIVTVAADSDSAVPAFTALRGGTVTGTVTSASSGQAVPYAQVEVASTTFTQAYRVYATADAAGQFTAIGVPAGQAIAKFSDPSGALAYQFSGGVPGPESAAVPFAVTEGGTATADAQLTAAAHITGTVTDTNSAPQQGISVSARRMTGPGPYDYSYEVSSWATTNAAGAYDLGGLATGSYQVQFYDARTARTLVTQWYPGGGASSATRIDVTAPGVTAGTDVSMPSGTSISGRLVNASNLPLANTYVSAYNNDFSSSGLTDANGVFVIPALADGDYRVSTYVSGRSYYYPNTTDYSSAELVTVSGGAPEQIGDLTVSITGCATSTVSLTSSPQPSSTGESVTFTATVTGSGGIDPTGVVRFIVDGSSLGQRTLDGSGSATLDTSSLSVGPHTVWAVYEGDAEYAPARSDYRTHTVTQTSLIATSTTIGFSANPVASTASVDLLATVAVGASDPDATGTVTFREGGTTLGTASLTAGKARATVTGLSVGEHQITAHYGGSTTHQASMSTPATLEVLSAQNTVIVHVRDGSGTGLAGASVSVQTAGGQSIKAVTDANGDASAVIPEPGSIVAYAIKPGYRPGKAAGTVGQAGGELTVTLQAGALGASLLSAKRLTLEEITALGIDPNDADNSNVESFKITIPGVGVLCGVANNAGILPSGGTSDPDCLPARSFTYGDRNFDVVGSSTYVSILESPGAHFLKEFFDVKLTIVNLSDPGFAFDPGTASLSLPSGLSLAPTAEAQSLSQVLPAIDGGASASLDWIVRGDTAGQYTLTAAAATSLPIPGLPDVPVAFEASTQIKVWGGDAVQLIVEAEDAVYAHHPYRVRLGLKNVSDVPVYAAGVGLSPAVSAQPYIFQPEQQMTFYTPSISPGQTWWSGDFVLISPNDSPVDVSQITIQKLSGNVTLATSTSATTAKFGPGTFPPISATPQVEAVRLDWSPRPGASEYRVYTTSGELVSFGSTPVSSTDAATSSVEIEAPAGVPIWYAVVPIVDGLAAMDHEMLVATALSPPPPPPPASGGGSGSGSGGSSSGGSTDSGGSNGAGTGTTGSQPSQPSAPPALARPKCEKVLFIGARGSGQKANENDGQTNMGEQVYHVWQQVRRSLGAQRTNYLAVPKPPYTARAVGVIATDPPAYFKGMEGGVDWVLGQLRARQSPCPSERIILSGYSQGAMVMHRVLQELDDPWIIDADDRRILRRIDGAVLIADGDRVPGEETVNYGSAGRGTGVGYKMRAISGTRGARLSDGLLSRVHSICNKNDLVCDYRPAWHTTVVTIGAGVSTHLEAYLDTGDVRLAASRVARRAGERL